MRKLVRLVSLLAVSCPLMVLGWEVHGHTLVGDAAARRLPQDAPAFFRAASDRLAYLNSEPDRWRERADQAWGPAVTGATSADHLIFLDLVPAEALQAPDRFTYLELLRQRGIVSPVSRMRIPGFLPFRILELTQQLRGDFRRWRAATDPRQREWIEERVIDDAGILGHYVADGANPHHTTIHAFGWIGANERGYATDPEFHGRFEDQYVLAHIQLEDILGKVPTQARVLRDTRAAVLQYLAQSHSLVERLYQLDREERFGPSTAGAAHREFAVERLVDGAAMLRDLWWTAWITSGEAPPAATP